MLVKRFQQDGGSEVVVGKLKKKIVKNFDKKISEVSGGGGSLQLKKKILEKMLITNFNQSVVVRVV